MSETWTPRFAPPAVRDLNRLPHKVAMACVEFITRTLPTNPFQMSSPLREELEGFRSARRGEYRILFETLQDDHVLHVIRISHRRDAYRPISLD